MLACGVRLLVNGNEQSCHMYLEAAATVNVALPSYQH